MVRGWKFIILLGGAVGVAAFFLPFVTVTRGEQEVELSAFDAVRGVDAVQEEVDAQAGSAATAEMKAASDEMEVILEQLEVFLYGVYAPAFLIALLAMVGVSRMRVGRVLATVFFLLGLATIAIWFLLFRAADEAFTGAPGGAEASLGLGVHLLLVTGIAAALGGLVNAFKPDRGYPTI